MKRTDLIGINLISLRLTKLGARKRVSCGVPYVA